MPRWSVDGGDQPSIDNLTAGDVNRTERRKLVGDFTVTRLAL